jgi:hypothetical protein
MTLPRSGVRSPDASLRKVVFPAPFSPEMPRKPGWISSDSSLMIGLDEAS